MTGKTSEINKSVLKIAGDEVSMTQLINAVRTTGLMEKVIREVIMDKELEKYEIGKEENYKLLDEFRKSNINNPNLVEEKRYKNYLNNNCINEELLIKVLSRKKKVEIYKKERWGTRVSSIYLKRKDEYNCVSYNKFELNNHNIAQEIYFRIKDEEETWENIAYQIGGGTTKIKHIYSNVPVNKMDKRILAELEKCKEGNICKPIKMANRSVLVGLIKFHGKILDEDLKNILLEEELNTWLNTEVKKVKRSLTAN